MPGLHWLAAMSRRKDHRIRLLPELEPLGTPDQLAKAVVLLVVSTWANCTPGSHSSQPFAAGLCAFYQRAIHHTIYSETHQTGPTCERTAAWFGLLQSLRQRSCDVPCVRIGGLAGRLRSWLTNVRVPLLSGADGAPQLGENQPALSPYQAGSSARC